MNIVNLSNVWFRPKADITFEWLPRPMEVQWVDSLNARSGTKSHETALKRPQGGKRAELICDGFSAVEVDI